MDNKLKTFDEFWKTLHPDIDYPGVFGEELLNVQTRTFTAVAKYQTYLAGWLWSMTQAEKKTKTKMKRWRCWGCEEEGTERTPEIACTLSIKAEDFENVPEVCPFSCNESCVWEKDED